MKSTYQWKNTDTKPKTENTPCLHSAMEKKQVKIQNTQVKKNFK